MRHIVVGECSDGDKRGFLQALDMFILEGQRVLGKSSTLKFRLAFNEPESVPRLSGHHKDFELHCKSNTMSLDNSKQDWCFEGFLWMLPWNREARVEGWRR